MSRPFILGLTGSIGMGKSTASAMFRDMGIPVWDADEAVRRLYGPDGAGSKAIARLKPDAVGPRGVDRGALKDWISADPAALPRIEAAIHPLVARDRETFIGQATTDIVLLDIPLLFETGGAAHVDHVVVVSAPEAEQRRRVLARPGMSERDLDAILARQIPDAEKRRRADTVVESVDPGDTRRQIAALLSRLRRENDNA